MYRFYVSSYAKGKEKGLYVCTLDETKNELHLNKHIPTEDFPSYVIKKDDYLYVSLKDARVGEGGGVASYHIEEDDLKQLSFYNSHGRSYTHLCLSPDQKYLFTANYHVGATAAFPLKDHKIGDKLSVVHHHGSGIDLLKRQTSPHAHYVGITPDQKYLYSVDLGADKIVMYEFIDEKLQELGFDKYEISNYAKKGYESKHNLVYWRFENYYGIGLGSCGKNNHQIIEHSRSLTKYLNGDFKTTTIEQSKEEMMFDQVMMSLRLVEGLNLEVFKERYQEDACILYKEAVTRNIEKGRLMIENDYLKATQEGQYVLNDILIDFMK